MTEPKKKKVEAVDETPSGVALAEVGNLDGEKAKPSELEKHLEHGEAYQAAKKKARWG